MSRAFMVAMLGMVIWHVPQNISSPATKINSTSKVQAADPQPKQANSPPKLLHHFPTSARIERVTTIAYSADGKLVAVANGNPTFVLLGNGKSEVVNNWLAAAEILDAETGKTVARLKLSTAEEDVLLAATDRVPPYQVTALAFSPDGTMLAVGTTVGQVKLFEVRTGKLRMSLDDEKAKLADKNTPENLRPFMRAMGSVAALAFSPDGNLLATCGESFGDSRLVFDGIERLTLSVTGPGRLKVWEVKTGKLKHDLVGHDRHATAVAFSPDEKLLASAGNWMSGDRSHGTGAIIWNPLTGDKIRTLASNTNGGAHSVAFSPDSKLLVIGSLVFDKDSDKSSTALTLIKIGSGLMEWQHSVGGWANAKAFTPDGKSLVALCGGQSIRFFDTQTGKMNHEIGSPDSRKGGRWNDFAIAPQGRKLAIGGLNAKTGFVEVWDLDGAPAKGQ